MLANAACLQEHPIAANPHANVVRLLNRYAPCIGCAWLGAQKVESIRLMLVVARHLIGN